MICARCQQPILRDQDYETLGKFSSSGAGATIVVHTVCPPKGH
ncbi:hypothetical protein [Streptomyces lunaelactis]|nr:hypothetical protein [Streptomyces lunaelactis]